MFPGPALYAGIAALAVFDLIWVFLAGIHIIPETIPFAFLPALAFLAVAAEARFFSRRHEKWQPYCETAYVLLMGLLFIRLAWIFVRLFNHLTATVPYNYADGWLAQADKFLHLDWNGYFSFVIAHPLLLQIFAMAYGSLTILSVLAYAGLILRKEIKTAEFFITTFFACAMICITIGMFFPALGAAAVLTEPEQLKVFAKNTNTYQVSYLNRLRSDGPVFIDLMKMPGLVSFPSFHTAAGIVLAWSYRGSRIFWAVLAYTIVLIASTPVNGGHYFIDVIAGAGVAFAVLSGFNKLPRYRELFRT